MKTERWKGQQRLIPIYIAIWFLPTHRNISDRAKLGGRRSGTKKTINLSLYCNNHNESTDQGPKLYSSHISK